MKKFEYHRAVNLGVEDMNILGLKGWELISCYEHIKPNIIYYIFKREITE